MKKKTKFFLPTIAIAILLAGTAYADVSNNDTNNSSSSIGQAATDSAITAAVKAKLLAHKNITSAGDISVETTNGIVTLTGNAKNKKEAIIAAHTAKNVRGVIKVVNNIETK